MRRDDGRTVETLGVCTLCPGSTSFAGGVGRCVANLMEAMPRVATDIRYHFIDTRGSRHIVFSPAYFAVALARLTWLLATGKASIVHINLAASGSTIRKFFVVLLGSAFRAPMVIHLHDGRYDSFHRSLPAPARRMVRWMFERADHVVALGANWKRMLAEEVGVDARKIDVIYNAVPAPERLAAGPAQGEPVHLLYLGRLWERKGISDLIEALARPEVRDLHWRATLAGQHDPGPYKEQARRLGIADKIEFPGWQDRRGVDRLLDGASALVLPSLFEGQPMVVLEALASGVPVVSTRVGSLEEYLTDGDSALLVDVRDVDGLARALERVISSPELRARLAERGRAVFARHFDVADAARRMAEIYRRIDKARSGHATIAPAEG